MKIDDDKLDIAGGAPLYDGNGKQIEGIFCWSVEDEETHREGVAKNPNFCGGTPGSCGYGPCSTPGCRNYFRYWEKTGGNKDPNDSKYYCYVCRPDLKGK